MPLGVVLAEYVTKSCLAFLPVAQQEMIDRMLRTIGINLRSVDLGQVGKSALSVAFTGSPLQGPVHPEHDHVSVQQGLDEAIREMRIIASMPCPLPAEQHECFVHTLHASPFDVPTAALKAYGATGCVWTKGGLTPLVVREGVPSVRAVENAYAEWHGLAAHGVEVMALLFGAGPSIAAPRI
jgi:hypothetical protein